MTNKIKNTLEQEAREGKLLEIHEYMVFASVDGECSDEMEKAFDLAIDRLQNFLDENKIIFIRESKMGTHYYCFRVISRYEAVVSNVVMLLSAGVKGMYNEDITYLVYPLNLLCSPERKEIGGCSGASFKIDIHCHNKN